MKKKSIILLVLIALCVLGVGLYRFFQIPDGSTVESREEMLKGIPQGTQWNIAQDQALDNYLLSCIYSDSKSGIAVFESNGNEKYKLVSREWRDADDIVISGFIIGNQWYDLIWFNGASTSYAEVIYTIDGVKAEPTIFDASDMKIICSKAPAKDYSLEVKYYDNDGNVYE